MHQVFVSNSVHLLILQFRAPNKDQIQSQECLVDCCIISREQLFPEQCTIQYALYRLAWRGWMRLSATLTGQSSTRRPLDVALDGVSRVYEWWSGRPAWAVAPRRYQLVTQMDGNVSLSETGRTDIGFGWMMAVTTRMGCECVRHWKLFAVMCRLLAGGWGG
jgi:hypothetical protein